MIGPLLSSRTITRRRVTAGAFDAQGLPTETTTDTSVAGDPQPLNGADLRALPEGVRADRTLKVYSPPGTWRTADARSSRLPDRAVIDGDEYVVVGVDRRASGIISHDKAYLERLPEVSS